MAVTYATGASGTISIDGGTIAITKWGCSSKYAEHDTTSSKDYDTNSTTLYKSQMKTSLGADFTWEGFLDTSNTGFNAVNTGIVTALKTSNAPVAVVLDYAANSTFASFNGDVLAFDVELTVDGVVTAKGSGKSNGPITYA